MKSNANEQIKSSIMRNDLDSFVLSLNEGASLKTVSAHGSTLMKLAKEHNAYDILPILQELTWSIQRNNMIQMADYCEQIVADKQKKAAATNERSI